MKILAKKIAIDGKLIYEIFKFGVVGAIGTAINLLVLYSFTEYLGIYYVISGVFAFFISGLNNFILNKVWTFRESAGGDVARKYVKFVIVSAAALAVNMAFLYAFTEYLGIYYILSQVLAICIAFVINFIGNKLWVFDGRK
jgi:dolichol-phosphate mannosyltransferase